MQREDRDSFLRELAEVFQGVDSLFEEYGIDAPSIDCESDDCELPDDHDVITLRNLSAEAYVILKEYMT